MMERVADDLPPTMTARIDEVCDRFEAAWKADPPPRLEDHLDVVTGPARTRLLRHLLAVELAYRYRRGERPAPQEYRGRFPGLEAAVEAAFDAAGPPEPRPEARPAPAGPRPERAADRNLLFGILALQMDFISRDALIAAMNAWVLDKTKTLGQVLVTQGALDPHDLALLEPMIARHVQIHGDDPERSLAALGLLGPVRHDLEAIADSDLQASLRRVAADRAPDDPDDTLSYAAGAPTSAAAGAPTSAGTRFRILRRHARGGLGEVYVARDEELKREVALKEIQAPYADYPEYRSRFVLEAEITGGLEHPGIVPVYGLGAYPDGRPFYAMRLIKGDSLRHAIQRFHQPEAPVPDPGEQAVALRQLLGRFIAVCNAIAYAHSRGVLHRDLKPGNVMLGPYGETLVVDWGLAKAAGRPEGAAQDAEGTLRPEAAERIDQTTPGSQVGTPSYMSPEQAAGAAFGTERIIDLEKPNSLRPLRPLGKA